MRPYFKITFLPMIMLVLSLSTLAGDDAFVTGKIIERVAEIAEPTQSYALYLPSSYDPKKRYPIIYAFDPVGRGSLGVRSYQKAAEKYGYIVVGSNDSQNGVDAVKLTPILNNLLHDTNDRLSIDGGRVLATGFSGGARVATALANACRDCVFGVIGSGAGFSEGVAVSKSLPFIFLGTSGIDDFNYSELRDLQKKLTSTGITNRLLTFDGQHQWPPEPIADLAIEWFEIQEMKAGKQSKDDAVIASVFAARAQRADALIGAKNNMAAHDELVSLVADFSGWLDTSAITKKLTDLERSREYKDELRAETEGFKTQAAQMDEIIGLEEMLSSPSRADMFPQLRQRVRDLRTHFDDAVDSPQRRLSRRVLNGVFVSMFQGALLSDERNRKYDDALAKLDLATEIAPKNAEVQYDRARLFALNKNKKKAVEALSKAIELGFKNVERIAQEQAFDAIRQDENFVRAVKGMTP
jgi:tetratricopeptide (TPR) repeat protein